MFGGDEYNRPFAPDKFEVLYDRMLGFLQSRDVFVQDLYAGADENYRLPIRMVTELAWHSMFARNMFIAPQSLEEYKRFVPEFTIVALPSFKGMPSVDNTATETFICLSFEKKLAIIGNTAYRRRDKEIGLHDFELSASARRRAFNALLGECQSEGRG